jgi:hypothetical protein
MLTVPKMIDLNDVFTRNGIIVFFLHKEIVVLPPPSSCIEILY